MGATDELRVAIGGGPGEVDDRIALVAVLAARRLWGDVDRELDGLVLAAPRRAEVRFLIAYAALARERFSDAETAAGEALALRPRYPEARLVRAAALARQGRDAEARRDLEQFLAEGAARASRRSAPAPRPSCGSRARGRLRRDAAPLPGLADG